ncbi:alternative ribosome rescue aminoacyl-tRNA hydrolase ArfB [Roseivirga sp.]|uniref:alternative ribosome rescue aminoacyl-tRNA hydrolase ArfB n=1 Tax=Roseivirga sp. TaxID=1964215 RepID=UPI002B27535A|nr:alternative ribosome rescue aminoacyl-tRNA hydrolase ArfB [Roseivirga sp.]
MKDPKTIASRDFLPELQFQTSRSSGPGGQNVNKLETRVTLRFNVENSYVFSEEEKELLLQKWAKLFTNEGDILISSEAHRTQLRNKDEVITKFRKAVEQAFTKPKLRRKTKPSKGAIQKRLTSKKNQSEKKDMRKPPKY